MRRLESMLIALTCVVALTACEGPEGPQGPAGAQGAQGPAGPAGPQGPAGEDATAGCTDCHVNDVFLLGKQQQYAQSIHKTGGHLYSNSPCAACHSHQGFMERKDTDTYGVAANIADPVPANCRTCHKIHTTYTEADFAFTATTPFKLFNEDPVTRVRETADLGEYAGNLCGRCHQSRPLRERVGGGLDSIPVINGPNVRVSSSRYGFHYGTQGQVLGGFGAYEFTGTETINGGPTAHGNPDKNEKMCATCHMAAPAGGGSASLELGGHTWNVSFHSNGDEEENVAGCNVSGCHEGSVADFDALGDVQGDVLGLLMQLDTLLVNKGIKQMYSPGYGIHELEYYAKTGTYNANLAAAMANWAMFAWDRSKGIHNPRYARSVLRNTIGVVKALP